MSVVLRKYPPRFGDARIFMWSGYNTSIIVAANFFQKPAAPNMESTGCRRLRPLLPFARRVTCIESLSKPRKMWYDVCSSWKVAIAAADIPRDIRDDPETRDERSECSEICQHVYLRKPARERQERRWEVEEVDHLRSLRKKGGSSCIVRVSEASPAVLIEKRKGLKLSTNHHERSCWDMFAPPFFNYFGGIEQQPRE